MREPTYGFPITDEGMANVQWYSSLFFHHCPSEAITRPSCPSDISANANGCNAPFSKPLLFPLQFRIMVTHIDNQKLLLTTKTLWIARDTLGSQYFVYTLSVYLWEHLWAASLLPAEFATRLFSGVYLIDFQYSVLILKVQHGITSMVNNIFGIYEALHKLLP